MKFIISALFIIMLFSSSCQTNNSHSIEILPLHPYTASPISYNPNEKPENSSITKYYFVKGATNATKELSVKLDAFIVSLLKNDSDYAKYQDYYLSFYRETYELNENYRQGKGTDETPVKHREDLLFKYSWLNKKFVGCNFYEDGKRVNTIFSNKGDVFKHDQSLELPQKEIILEEIPRTDSLK